MLKVFCLIEACDTEPPVVTGYAYEREALLAGLERIIDEVDLHGPMWSESPMTYDDLDSLEKTGTLDEVRKKFDEMVEVWNDINDQWLVVAPMWVMTEGRD